MPKRRELKTPGVYIEEKNAFPNAVVEVETAVPAFIGYTEKAQRDGTSLLNKPIRIQSLMEFERFYGAGAYSIYNLEEITAPSGNPANYDLKVEGKAYNLTAEKNTHFNLYESLKFFYNNGGGNCYILSVGTYGNGQVVPDFSSTPFLHGLTVLEKETEPSMLVIPDAVLLDAENCYSLQEQMLMHCGKLKSRFAILDIHSGDKGLNDPHFNPIDNFRNGIASSSSLCYGAAYYPWLHTTVLQQQGVSFNNLNKASKDILKTICENFVNANFNQEKKKALKPYIDLLSESEIVEKAKEVEKAKSILTTAQRANPQVASDIEKAKRNFETATKILEALEKITVEDINNTLYQVIPDYKLIIEVLLKKKNLLPPSGAMAGIYTSVDNQRGVWKAPANVGVNSVVSPAVIVTSEQQEGLNVSIHGKSICAIRPFIGRGVLVWGARTLDGNNLDFQYINVRRTTIMIEQSIKYAVKAYVFEPNDANTWVAVESMISNFLTNLWKRGALAGSSSADAFSVNVGLGKTMTSVDILEGIMRIQVAIALTRPAEFIVLTFEQHMQKS